MVQEEETEEEIKICRDCGGQIVWREGMNRRGEYKMFPFNVPPNLNVTTGQTTNYERHQCAEYQERRASQYKSLPTAQKAKGIPCNVCGAPITFSEDQRSPKTGKMVPLELSLERHQHRDRTVTQEEKPISQEQQQVFWEEEEKEY